MLVSGTPECRAPPVSSRLLLDPRSPPLRCSNLEPGLEAAEAAAAKHPQNGVSVGEIVSSPPPAGGGAAATARQPDAGSELAFLSARTASPRARRGCPSRWCKDAGVLEKVRARAARSG